MERYKIIKCNNDKVEAETVDGDTILCYHTDHDGRPFIAFSYEKKDFFLMGEYGEWHTASIIRWIMKDIVTPTLMEEADDMVDSVNNCIEDAVYEIKDNFEAEDWGYLDLSQFVDSEYPYICTERLENYISDAEDGNEPDINDYFITKEEACQYQANSHGFLYDEKENDFYIHIDNAGNGDAPLSSFLRTYLDISYLKEQIIDEAFFYGRIWTDSKIIGLSTLSKPSELRGFIVEIIEKTGISYDELRSYLIGRPDFKYLITVEDYLNGAFPTDEEEYDDEENEDDGEVPTHKSVKKFYPVIHNMNAKEKRESDQIKNYLSDKDRKYADIEASMRRLGKPDAMAYYNSLKTQEGVESKREIIINEGQLGKILSEEVVADGNADHNPYSLHWKMEREALIDYLVNYGQIMTSKENGKEYKVLYDTMLSQRLGMNFCVCVQWNPLEMTHGNIVYVRALDKFTPRRFRPQFDTRGRDNMSGTSDDVLPTNEDVRRIGSIIKSFL